MNPIVIILLATTITVAMIATAIALGRHLGRQRVRHSHPTEVDIVFNPLQTVPTPTTGEQWGVTPTRPGGRHAKETQ